MRFHISRDCTTKVSGRHPFPWLSVMGGRLWKDTYRTRRKLMQKGDIQTLLCLSAGYVNRKESTETYKYFKYLLGVGNDII